MSPIASCLHAFAGLSTDSRPASAPTLDPPTPPLWDSILSGKIVARSAQRAYVGLRVGLLAACAISATVALDAAPARAAEVAALIGGEFRVQGGKGGDVPKLEEEENVEGGLPELRLGDHFLVGLGVIISPLSLGRHSVEAEFFGGFSSWSTGRDSEANRLTSFGVPLDLLAFYRYRLSGDNAVPVFLRAGGGATYHAAWGIGSFGKYAGINYDLDDAFGGVFEGSLIYGVVGVGARYTRIKSKLSGTGRSLDMSSIAAFVNIIVEPGLEM